MSNAKKLSTALTQRPVVFDCHDYRVFLRQWLSYQKSEAYQFSLRKLSLSAGFSHSFLSHVLNEIRFLSIDSAKKLVSHLGLSIDEEKYFLSLVTMNESNDDKVRKKAIRVAQKIRVSHGLDPIAMETYEYLSAWYYVAIRELAFNKQFKKDPEWIRQQLHYPVAKSKIEKALNFLIENNFLVQQVGGGCMPSEKVISARGGAFQFLLGDFHKEMLELNKQAIDEVDKDKRKQVGFVLALDEDSFADVKIILEEAKAKIAALEGSCENPDRVYHVNLSSFPLAGGKS